MTKERILELAFQMALDTWYMNKIWCDEHPDNRILAARLARAQKELDEVAEYIYKHENKEPGA